ncbi:MAG: base plate wedge protein [Ectothiorhodospiraceae bacterium]|nr:base plate wedge protein [Ectothiorhodospiraceae bacterium]|tara:strand:+ start:471 stop:1157 length:687 start_codon:yes stop_codon:yes gene_type:complete
MYFSLIPDIEYDNKPINYPFSEAEYTTAKNFFRRYTVSEDAFGYATFYNKYSVQDGINLETIANLYYGSPFYDWVIILTNNLINPLYSFPLDTYTLDKYIEDLYGVDDQGVNIAYSKIHHYETIETKSGRVVDGIDVLALKGGLKVDKNFYDSPFTYSDGSQSITIPGNTVSRPVTAYEHETAENEKKREIYILKREYFNVFVSEFKKGMQYSKSSKYISNRLKKVAV